MHLRDSCLLSTHNEAIKHERWGRGGGGEGRQHINQRLGNYLHAKMRKRC